MTPQDFISKWQDASLKERSAAQEHFLDLCRLLEHPTPAEIDRVGDSFTFERPVSKAAGGKGYADVWKRGFFAWEYKGRTKDLGAAYLQLLQYRDDLENPPLLVVCDLHTFEVHTNFTGTPKKVYRFTLHDLKDAETLRLLRDTFTNPDALNPKLRRERVTQEASERIGKLALRLQERGQVPERIAHFLMQLVFAFFAEDINLLPNRVLSRILEKTRLNPQMAQSYLSELFAAMATGGVAALEEIPYFNGGLFEGTEALPLETADLRILHEAAQLDWSEVEPVIFGTLFERSLDPAKRSQLGLHYTGRSDILRIVEPVIIAPLRAEWQAVRGAAEAYLQAPTANAKAAARERDKWVNKPISDYLEKLHALRVLDPACGSGNFLYVAMQQLKELEREAVTFAQGVGAPGLMLLSPRQFYGLEVNIFAHELASMVVWIGYLQWNHANGISNAQVPVLEKLNNIRRQDALLDGEEEREWPHAEYVIGNPPFLGNYKMRQELGDAYTETLYRVYGERIPNRADFVCYWFEKARGLIARGFSKRAGLIGTNSIRGAANRKVLENIKETGDIFMGWADEPWILDGAAVRVSIVGFDDGTQTRRFLDGEEVAEVYADLTAGKDYGLAKPLKDNLEVSFKGIEPSGAFDIPEELALAWLNSPNPDGVSNSDVLRVFVGAKDIVQRSSKRWLIDFNDMSLDDAERYLVPLSYVRQKVKPSRDKNKEDSRREKWWLHGRNRPAMRDALSQFERFICTPRHSKHRVFVWLDGGVIPESATVVIAKDDDFTFGVLHSLPHELWALKKGSSLEDRPRYTNTTCFETFPFPRPTEAQHSEIEKWAKYLDNVRQGLLESDKKRTMTGLYNDLTELRITRDTTHPVFPLLLAHEGLDGAVYDAYGWDYPLPDEEVLGRLLRLNLERAAGERG